MNVKEKSLDFFDRIERLSGFRPIICLLISLACRKLVFRGIFKKTINSATSFDVIISNNHMEYFDQIHEIINLVSQTYKVGLLFEGNERKFDILLKEKFPQSILLPINHRLLPGLSTRIYLSSIAGKENYFPKCPKKVFYFHGLAGISGFKTNGMNAYSDIFCATLYQQKQIASLYPKKRSVIVGYPKLSKVETLATRKIPESNIRVLYAPTLRRMLPFDTKDIFLKDLNILRSICQAEKVEKVFYKPHPQEVRDKGETFFINLINDTRTKEKKLILDLETSQSRIFNCSDILVTDYSGTAITFALKEGKPTFFVAENVDYLAKLNPLAILLSNIVNSYEQLSKAFLSASFFIKNFQENRDSALVIHKEAKEKFVREIQDILDSEFSL
jgi:hypothetical protein